VLLGSAPWSEAIAKVGRDGFLALTPATITDEGVLRAEVERAKVDGYAVAHEETVAGISTLAVPVPGPKGHVIAALGVSMKTEMLVGYLHQHLRSVVTAAAGLGRSLRQPAA
jgi:IclR family pca regulon transcriptional regulator